MPKGYGLIQRGGDGTGRAPLKAHRVAWALANGVDPLTMPRTQIIRHTCDNPPCCNSRHLLEGSMKDNNGDTAARGKAHWQSGRRDAQGRFS